MRITRWLIPLVLILIPLTALAGPKKKNAGAKKTEKTSLAKSIAGMGWIAGDWEGPMWGGTFHSYYSTPEGGRVISYSKLTKNGETAFHEFEVFERDGGNVVFRPYPRGKPATPLTLIECDARKQQVVFENPDKDFPTRIVYHRVADDRLVITLTDPHHDSDKVETFDLKRK